MSKMGRHVLEIQTQQHEEYAHEQAESVRGSRLGNKPSMGYDMVRGSLPASDRRGSTMYYSGGAAHYPEQGGCNGRPQFDWVRFGETA